METKTVTEVQIKTESKSKPRIRILKWGEMLKAPPEPNWILKNLFASGSVITMYGSGGSKKTYSAIDMIMSIHTKSDWLGFEIKQPVPILVIDEESGQNRLSARYIEARNGYKTKTELPIYTICMARFSLRDKTEKNLLRQYIKVTKAKLLVIDSLVTVLNGDENSSKEITQLYINLKSIAEEFDCAILVIHHSNKLEGYRGSSAIRDQSDLLIQVSSKNTSPNIDFKTEKERDIPHTEWAAVSHLEKGKSFYLVSSHSKLKRLGKAQEIVLNYISTYDRATMEDLKNNSGDCASSAVRNAAYKLLENHYVTNDVFKGKSRIFELTEIGKDYAKRYLPSGFGFLESSE